MMKLSTEAQSVSIGSPNGGKVLHNCASVQSELFSSSHWVGPRMTCLNLGESALGGQGGWGKKGSGTFSVFLLYRENWRSVCEREREREISSIRDLHLVNHIKKIKRFETRCTALMLALKDSFRISLLCLVNTIPDLIL